MKRKSNRRKRNLIVVGGLLLATVVLSSAFLVGSGAVFTATSANPANVFTAGTLSIDNSREGAAILTAGSNMAPGDPATTGTVVIQNDGTLPGTFSLTGTQTNSSGAAINGVLDLVIMEGATEIYSGKLSAFAPEDLGVWAAGATHTYDFAVSLPASADDTYQGASSTYRFVWDAIQ